MVNNGDRGYDRKQSRTEADLPDDQKPWTEYDVNGNKLVRPDPKGCGIKPCICCCGEDLCVYELQWPVWMCGRDADRCCDVVCRCRCGRCKTFICCGGQCDDSCCTCCNNRCTCCKSLDVAAEECCACDCNSCNKRFMGCQLCCCHMTFMKCPRCCDCLCCCCTEEGLRMDGDFVPFRDAAKDSVVDNIVSTQPTSGEVRRVSSA